MLLTHEGVPLVGVVAASGTGKTTLLRAVIPLLDAAGLRIGCVKHTHHPFEIDHRGKDSYLLREAGARQMLLGSAGRWALMVETHDPVDVPLRELIGRLALAELDLVLVEGYRLEEIPRIEIHRAELGGPLLCESLPGVIALATNLAHAPTLPIPVLALDDPAVIAGFLIEHVARLRGLQPVSPTA
ncbi:MAG: molybdopterin-guanine dinucleotide biosynthesis protein B [Gammaproteobacteria bacterium]